VAQRLAIDHPGAVRRLCLMDGIPIGEALARWMEDLYGDPLAIWRDWADDVRGQPVDCGHHIAEEAPAELAALLAGFFAA
jgi:pimeloyl-ACP methyl ester carboxylesterase